MAWNVFVCIVVGCLFFPQLVSLCQCWPLRLMHEYYISSTQGKYTTEMCIYKPNVFGWRLFSNGIIITSIEAQALDHFSHISCTLCNDFITFFSKMIQCFGTVKSPTDYCEMSSVHFLPPLPLTPQPFSKYSCSTRSDGASVSLVVLVQENYRLFHWKYCDRQHCKCNFHLWYIRTHKYRIWRSVSFSVSFAICHSTALQSQSMKEMLCIAPQ